MKGQGRENCAAPCRSHHPCVPIEIQTDQNETKLKVHFLKCLGPPMWLLTAELTPLGKGRVRHHRKFYWTVLIERQDCGATLFIL